MAAICLSGCRMPRQPYGAPHGQYLDQPLRGGGPRPPPRGGYGWPDGRPGGGPWAPPAAGMPPFEPLPPPPQQPQAGRWRGGHYLRER